MKKGFLILLFFGFAFTSCISTFKTEPSENDILVSLKNETPWELNIRIRKYYFSLTDNFTLGKQPETLILNKNTNYKIYISSRFDVEEEAFVLKTPDSNIVYRISWDSFDGKYHIFY